MKKGKTKQRGEVKGESKEYVRVLRRPPRGKTRTPQRVGSCKVHTQKKSRRDQRKTTSGKDWEKKDIVFQLGGGRHSPAGEHENAARCKIRRKRGSNSY